MYLLTWKTGIRKLTSNLLKSPVIGKFDSQPT